jgi:hypothetical protein
MGDSGPGCFAAGASTTDGQLFGWEFFNSFILVSVVYAVAIGSPSFGEFNGSFLTPSPNVLVGPLQFRHSDLRGRISDAVCS